MFTVWVTIGRSGTPRLISTTSLVAAGIISFFAVVLTDAAADLDERRRAGDRRVILRFCIPSIAGRVILHP